MHWLCNLRTKMNINTADNMNQELRNLKFYAGIITAFAISIVISYNTGVNAGKYKKEQLILKNYINAKIEPIPKNTRHIETNKKPNTKSVNTRMELTSNLFGYDVLIDQSATQHPTEQNEKDKQNKRLTELMLNYSQCAR